MIRSALLLSALALSSTALAQDVEAAEGVEDAPPATSSTGKKALHSGEFRNTAHSTEKGEVVLHPLFLPSSYGVTDNLDIKFPTLGIIGGPSFGAEYMIFGDEDMAVSIEENLSSNWGFSSYSSTTWGRFTKGLGKNRLNISAGFSAGQQIVVDLQNNTQTSVFSIGVPINVGFDLVTKDTAAWRFVYSSDATAPTAGILGINWNKRTGEKFAISLGVATYIGVVPGLADAFDAVGINFPGVAVLPLPTFEMWWKL